MIELRTDEDRLAASGEFVLGTLGDDDRAAFAEAMQRDRGLRAAVYDWQDRLLGLSLRAAAATPSAAVWKRTELALDAAANAPVARTTRAAPALVRWWQRVASWQAISAVAVAASLLMAVLLIERQPGASSANARYLAVLQSPDDKSTGWIVELEANRSLRLVPVAAIAAAPAGRSLQFWTKPQGAAGPTSLGLVRTGQTLEMPVAKLPGVGERQLFEITLEPESGSPLGRPTGPILYVGRTVRL